MRSATAPSGPSWSNCSRLFAVQEQAGDSGSQDLGTNPVVKKWWDYMADIMDVNPDNSPVSIPLKEVFYMK